MHTLEARLAEALQQVEFIVALSIERGPMEALRKGHRGNVARTAKWLRRALEGAIENQPVTPRGLPKRAPDEPSDDELDAICAAMDAKGVTP